MSLFDLFLGGIASDDKGCDWYCDSCDAYMNSQPGFTVSSGEWTCTECGCDNDVSEDNIIYDENDLDAYHDNDYDDNDYDDDGGESLSVWDAAEIWRSNGYDEDYAFGYSEEDLRDALD